MFITDDIDEYTRMIILNIFHFKSAWLHPFDVKLTKSSPFYNFDNTINQVPTMHKTEHLLFGHIEKLDAKLIKLPYIVSRRKIL